MLGSSICLLLSGTLHNSAQGCLPFLAAGQLCLQIQDLRGEGTSMSNVMLTEFARVLWLGLGAAGPQMLCHSPPMSSSTGANLRRSRSHL